MTYLNKNRHLGKLCTRQHRYKNTEQSERYNSGNQQCCTCRKIDYLKWKESNPKRFKQLQKKYRDKHTDDDRTREKAYQANYYLNVNKGRREAVKLAKATSLQEGK